MTQLRYSSPCTPANSPFCLAHALPLLAYQAKALWGGRPLTVERARQRYNPSEPTDAQALRLSEIEHLLSAVKTLKLAEVERWQAAEQERCTRGEGQQPAPDLSFLLYASAEVMPISRVAALAEEYDRLCAALPADDA